MRFIAKFFIRLVKIYQLLSAGKGPCCRFIPSCSEYAIGAITKYGIVKGLWLTIKRVLRCRPGFGKLKNCGYDPVP
ncbi:MAG: membrane protein insertion efficiency factor YidD [Holosporales bacterium]|nr:membrane protein insertion efficiency factor YidD [Holosporales bacterium]